MQLIATTTAYTGADIQARFDELSDTANGMMYFSEREVFIASGQTRVLVNAIPELCNIIEHFAFESARSVVENNNDIIGESMYEQSRVEEQVMQDITFMTQGKQRELIYLVRRRLSQYFNENDGQRVSALKYVPESFAKAAEFTFNDCDPIVKEMKEVGLFNKGSELSLSSAEETLTATMGDFIQEHAKCCDYEMFLDAMRINLGF